MELKHLLSIVVAALTALGAMLFAMGSQSPWLAMLLWFSAVASLVVTDFLEIVRLPRHVASLLMWGVLLVFLPHFIMQRNWDSRLQSVASILLCLQITIMFQDKDPRAYGWLAVISLLQAVVAARYSQGVAFGGLLVAYTLVGIFALALLALYSQWTIHRGRAERQMGRWGDGEMGRHGDLAISPSPPLPISPSPLLPFSPPRPAAGSRWPLAATSPRFSSAAAGSSRSGVVTELFARLTLIAVGALLLAAILFSTVPRPKLAAWRGDAPRKITTVGFDDQIALGGLGEIIEDPQEVMQLKLLDPVTRRVYPMREDIYLRGSVATSYSNNQWRRAPPLHDPTIEPNSVLDESYPEQAHIGRPVLQKITMEPGADRDDIFYIWPWVEPVPGSLIASEPTGRLLRRPKANGEPHGDYFQCEVLTSGLVDGRQAPLIPVGQVKGTPWDLQRLDPYPQRLGPYLRRLSEPPPLPRLTALAAQWLRENRLPANRHYEVARCFERQLSRSGQFHYSLQEQGRDRSIDAIEDFVSNHPSGHCEYFATALALMLRSQRIPSRVVLGYHCDEWHEDQQYYQVRQLHAHAWVEAFLAPEQIEKVPASLPGRPGTRQDADSFRVPGARPDLWNDGGWLRLDPTPAGEAGTRAAERTAWGTWRGRLHALQHSWEKYIVEMDHVRQRDAVYTPISRATRNFAVNVLNPRWWIGLAAGLWAYLAAMLRSGIMGSLLGVVVLIALVALPAAAGWWLVRRLARLWRRFSAARGGRAARTWIAVEFYRRFEQIARPLGLQRRAGQTPREFARVAGARLAQVSGRRELYTRALQVADAFYRVRFGRHKLDASAARTIEQALQELTAGSRGGAGKPESGAGR